MRKESLPGFIVIGGSSPVLAFALAAAICYLWQPFWMQNCQHIAPFKFSTQNWERACDNGDSGLLDRARMLNDLKARFNLIGMTRKEITHLLGVGFWHETGDDLKYNIGNGDFILHFEHDKVSGYRIFPH